MNENQIPKYLTTREAAQALMRKESTMYAWAHKANGPLQPIRVHGRLAWSADEISSLLKAGKVAGDE